ncbi:MAG: DUF4124 domain-containing protein [Gammaproteobacteria bacterium]|nr:DUF4124 domain-containing protein [Gammaproteobacteria bacterium]
MKFTLHNIRYLVFLPAFLVVTAVSAERTFKWVDEEGNIHFGDRVPPRYANIEREEINEHGRTVKVYEAPKTAEEKAEIRRQAELEAAEKERAKKRAIHDRSLLATYTSEEDMLMARDGKIASVDALIQLTSSRIESSRKRLLTLETEAAEFERSGKPVPKILQSQITTARSQLIENEAFVITKEKEKQVITEKFSADISRYRELKGL